MRVTIVTAVNISGILIGWHHRLRDNDGHNETVNTKDTRHDNGHNIFDNSGGVINAHVADAESGTPGAPSAAPTGQNHANGGAHVAAVVIII